jgi:hypothetical protein
MKNNRILILLIALYSLAMFSVISWGIPSETRPFTYNMDEWHQLSAVRALFKYGTPNVPGAAHGSIFQFLLSGIYLVPFTVLGFVNPFSIHSLVDNLAMQNRLFIIMRSNTLFFGVLSILALASIAKKYLKINSILVAILFIGTPIWLTLSSYFKYDIALIFWICLSVLFLLRYGKNPTLRNFIYVAILCSLSFATKVSAIPMLIIYIFSFFWFTPQWKKKYKNLILGIVVFLSIFIIFGIPDLLFRLSDYKEYLSSNLLTSVKSDSNFLIGVSNKWVYILFVLFPMIFGHIFYVLFIIAFIYSVFQIAKWLFYKKYADHKVDIFIFFSFLLFFLSLIPLGLGASGNRALVLLPFFGLITAKFINNMFKFHKFKIFLIILVSVLAILQFRESSIVVYSKYGKSVSQESSSWITKNISKDTIVGIENIPIYQTLPDIILKEYYLKLTNKNAKTIYNYEVISATSKKLPRIVIITNRYLDEKYLIKSPKKDLIKRLKVENYKIIKEFFPSPELYKLYKNDSAYYLSGLNFVFPVTIYEKEL